MTSFFPVCIVLGTMCVGLLSAVTETPVSGTVGSRTVLPCELQNVGTKTPYIRWIIKSRTVFEREGENAYQGEGYESRVDVPEEELRKGNCSLVLNNLKPSDAAVYTSYQGVRRSKRTPESNLISRVTLSVSEESKPDEETNKKSVPEIPDQRENQNTPQKQLSGDAGMKFPYPLIIVLSFLSCLFF